MKQRNQRNRERSFKNMIKLSLVLFLLQSDHHLGGFQRRPLPLRVEDAPPPDALLAIHIVVGRVQPVEVAVRAVLEPGRETQMGNSNSETNSYPIISLSKATLGAVHK